VESVILFLAGGLIGFVLVTVGIRVGRRTSDPCPRSKVGHGWRPLQIRGRRMCAGCGCVDDFGVRYPSFRAMCEAEKAEREERRAMIASDSERGRDRTPKDV
jgi:hypothetical protein